MERVTCRGANLRLGSPPLDEIGIAMCRTPMFANTHGRSGWFNGYQNVRQYVCVARALGGRRGDDSTGNAVTGIAGGIGLHIVGFLVDDDGGAAVGDDAVR